MPRAKKDGEYLHCYIDSTLMKRLDNYLEESRLSKTVATEIALERFLDEEDKKKEILSNN